MRPMLLIATMVVAVGGCASEDKAQTRQQLVVNDHRSDVVAIGVMPEAFACQSVAPKAEVEAILGSFEPYESQFEPPAGLAKPCNYLVKTDAGAEQWSFDIDCRDKATSDGKALMVQYATATDTTAVRVGESGVDYRGMALLFLDDDSPCYARVLGPTPSKRLALARLVSQNLDDRTAPTSLRYKREAESQPSEP